MKNKNKCHYFPTLMLIIKYLSCFIDLFSNSTVINSTRHNHNKMLVHVLSFSTEIERNSSEDENRHSLRECPTVYVLEKWLETADRICHHSDVLVNSCQHKSLSQAVNCTDESQTFDHHCWNDVCAFNPPTLKPGAELAFEMVLTRAAEITGKFKNP